MLSILNPPNGGHVFNPNISSESSLSNILKATTIGAGFYLIKKVIELVSTRPLNNPQNYTRAERFYAVCADIREEMERKIGKEDWEDFNCVFLDNLWISAFALTILLKDFSIYHKDFTKYQIILNAVTVWALSISIPKVIWLLRFNVARKISWCPSRVATFVMPKVVIKEPFLQQSLIKILIAITFSRVATTFKPLPNRLGIHKLFEEV